MTQRFDLTDAAQVLDASRAAREALQRGELVVLPTDTVYGVGADAFSPEAVQKLIDAKERTRQSPPPVLISGPQVMHALAAEVSDPVSMLANAFWPGALTLVTVAQPSLAWDLGETDGTVALRVPNHAATLSLLKDTGPLAVSSANLHGQPAAKNCDEAFEMLGDRVSVYLDAGSVSGDGAPSTILDVTELSQPDGTIRVLRQGALSRESIARLLPQAQITESS